MIPDEAVTAAVNVTQEVCETYDPGGWTEEENWAIWTRRILEAAAPILMAQAWDECASQPTRPADNPYEPAGHARKLVDIFGTMHDSRCDRDRCHPDCPEGRGRKALR